MRIPAPPLRALACAILPFASGAVRAAVFAVGDGPGCTHATIQAAIDAAEANPGDDFIRIPHDRVWNDQALVIDTAQVLNLEGYWADCNTIDTSGSKTTLDGAGGSAAPVLRIAGGAHHVSLDMFVLRNGDVGGADGKGGGLWYRGNGTLLIANTAITGNHAGLGGGLYLEGTGADATVVLSTNVAITGNTALTSGGGVFAEAVRLSMVAPNSIIAFNEATGYTAGDFTFGGYGGGLVVNNTTSLDGIATIGSSGVGAFGAVHGNSARYGGGIAVLGESGADTEARLYLHATEAGVPAKITQNFASVRGGGLYLARPYPVAVLWNAAIEGNAAADGAAIYLDGDGDVRFQYDWENDGVPAGGVSCPPDAPCGRISGNIDQDASGQPTGGAVIHIGDDAWRFELGCTIISPQPPLTGPRGIVIEDNRGGWLVDVGAPAWTCIGSTLVTGNALANGVLRTRDDYYARVRDSTIAGNAIGGASVFDFGGSHATLMRVLVWQPDVLSAVGGPPASQWVVASEAESLGGGPDAIAVPSPRFIDPERGDYRLRAASPAIDFAPPIVGDDRDAFGLPRDQDLGAIPAPVPERVRDVGAFERQGLSPLVLNGDFAGDANLWSLPPGHAGHFQVDNAPGGEAGTGSAQVAGSSSDGRLLGYLQCVHLPGPGVYGLNGSGRSEGDPQLANPTVLVWELRLDGGEGCIDGPIVGGGELTLGTRATTDQWMRPVDPARIVVTPAQWNHATSLSVILRVDPNAAGNGAYNGLFDRVTLAWLGAADDVIFRNGFDGAASSVAPRPRGMH